MLTDSLMQFRQLNQRAFRLSVRTALSEVDSEQGVVVAHGNINPNSYENLGLLCINGQQQSYHKLYHVG